MKRSVGTAVVLFLSLAPVRGWAQPVDLLSSESVAEAARKKPPAPGGFPVQPGIYRLHGSDPGLAQDDLEPLRKIVGTAPVVALGESVHTSGGYYEMKHRVFRFLVEKMGFRAFAIESDWQNADRVAEYVQTCSGTAEEALGGLFPVWRSAETRALVQWMCDWNRSHRKAKDKLHFFGFDIQQPEQDGPALIAFLERIGLGGGDPRIADLRRCDGVSGPTLLGNPLPEAQHQDCTRGLEAVERLFTDEGKRIAAETSPQELEYAKLRRVGLKAWHDLTSAGRPEAPGRPPQHRPVVPRISEANMVPGPQFDGAIFLAHSRKMDPLAWPPCQ